METSIFIAMAVAFVIGAYMGWSTTFDHFKRIEKAREAVDNYKAEQQRKSIANDYDYDANQRNALKELQRYCESYVVIDEDKKWTYQVGPDRKEKED